jgi:FkbM family methyltransferase
MKKFLLKFNISYFFYKIIKIFRNSKKNVHLGEFGEDIFVRRFFKKFKKGFYVDVGSYHPIKGSLTYDLYKKNWSGVNIDLSKISIDLFKLSRPKDINIRAAITDFDGKTFYYENSPINQQNSLKENSNAQKIEIDCYKLNTILETHEIKKIDYLNIDAEGNDFKVISTFNFNKFNPILVSIEFNDYNFNELINSNINILMERNNYKLVSKFGVTCFYIKKENIEKIQDIMNIK